MKKLWNCRRSLIAVFSISCLTTLGIMNNVDVSGSIAMVAGFICAANAAQGMFKKD